MNLKRKLKITKYVLLFLSVSLPAALTLLTLGTNVFFPWLIGFLAGILFANLTKEA